MFSALLRTAIDNLLTLALEAHNPELNHHRRYEIEIGRDLFDDWTLSIRYGRVGSVGQGKQFAVKQLEDLQRMVGERLKRRLTSEKRIGCKYRIVSLESWRSIPMHSLLPGELLARMF